MKILVAPDKFKGSLTAAEAAAEIERGMREVLPHAIFDRAGLADGGEGTVDVFCTANGAERKKAFCQDALGRPVQAEYAWIASERLAVIEMSAASGLARIGGNERDILRSTTFGTGQLIRDALTLDPRTIVVGLGGSATNDGGAGLAAALGWKFFDAANKSISPSPLNLGKIHAIEPPARRSEAEVLALADVRNPLLGPRGCSRMYGPQKGATEDLIGVLEAGLAHFADVCESTFQVSHRETPGAGAAGGTGFGLLTFSNAKIVAGFDWIATQIGLEARVAACDFVITGEGSIDCQTLEGKGPGALAAMAKHHRKPCFAFAGIVEPGAGHIFSKCIPISNPAIGLAENLARGAQSLRVAASEFANTLLS